MTPRKWTGPAGGFPPANAVRAPEVSGASQPWGLAEFAVHFVFCMVFFGLMGFFLSSAFPLALGVFLFFTGDRFVAWALAKAGIRLVPDTLGAEFVKAFVFLLGLAILLASWKDTVPAWLAPWLPVDGASWTVIGAAALFCAVLQITSTAVVRHLFPRMGIELAPDRQRLAALAVLGLLIALVLSLGASMS